MGPPPRHRRGGQVGLPLQEEDTVVPRAQLPALVSGVKEICSRYGVRSICHGHAGDGNVHVNLLREGMDDAGWERVGREAVPEIFALTVALGEDDLRRAWDRVDAEGVSPPRTRPGGDPDDERSSPCSTRPGS
ncbi:MAG: hypothetical protein MZV64_16660 [Ignavibacteriales bacterium]|nr:hypothetical protein [Ignavibacteriales bacterium]